MSESTTAGRSIRPTLEHPPGAQDGPAGSAPIPPPAGDRDAVAEALRRAEKAEAEVRHLREREAHFASVLGVCDGGQYRNDWDVRITRVLARAEAAEARVKDLEAALAWRPIESAPKDGTRIVWFDAENEDAGVCYWRHDEFKDDFRGWDCATATHWAPIPSAPEVPRA